MTAARRLGDAPLTAAALAVLALADSMTGAAERAEADRHEAAALVDSLSDDELARRIDAAAWLAGAELYLDRYAEAEAHAERALAVARATGQGELFLVLIADSWARCWRTRGKLAEAAELLGRRDRSGAPAGQHAGARVEPVRPLRRRAPVGDVGLALATAQESRRPQRRISRRASTRPGRPSSSPRALLETGQPEPAVELLVGSAGGEELMLIAGGGELTTSSCSRAAGSRSTAAPRRDARRRRGGVGLGAFSSRWPRAWADRAAAAVDLHAGDPRSAAEQALAAAAAADEVGAPIEAALSRTLAGRALAQAGRERACGRGATSARRRSSTPAGPCGTATRRRASCESSAIASTGARARARATGRARVADRARAPGRRGSSSTEDESRDRRRAVPQQEDGRDPSAQHLPQARRLVARRTGARGRARRSVGGRAAQARE